MLFSMITKIPKLTVDFVPVHILPQVDEKISNIRLVAYRALQILSALGTAILILAPGKICIIALGLGVPYLCFALAQLHTANMKTSASKANLLVRSLIFISIPLGAVAGVAAFSFGIKAVALLADAFVAKSLVGGLWSAWVATGTIGLLIPFATTMLKMPHLMENNFKELCNRCEKIAIKVIKKKCVQYYDFTSFFAICAKPATGTRFDLNPEFKAYNQATLYNWSDDEMKGILAQVLGEDFPLQEKLQRLVTINAEVEKLMQCKAPEEKEKTKRSLEAIIDELQIFSVKFDKALKLGFQLKDPHNFMLSIDQKASKFYASISNVDRGLLEEAYVALGAIGLRVIDCKKIAKSLKLPVNSDAFKTISDELAMRGVRNKKHLIDKGLLVEPPAQLTKLEVCKRIETFLTNSVKHRVNSSLTNILESTLSVIVLYTSLWAKVGLIARSLLGSRVPDLEFDLPSLNPQAGVMQKCRYTWVRLSGALLSIHVFAFGLLSGVFQAQFLRRQFQTFIRNR